MNIELLIISFIIIIGFSIIIYILNKKQNSSDNAALLEWIKTTQNQISETNKNINNTLRESNQHITSTLISNTNNLNQRLEKASEVIQGVQKNIGEMSEIGRSMKELQDFLNSPKLRGSIGEQVLKELLSQMLPKQSYKLQYTFKSGHIVDAIIKTEAGIIPIDSKFPMENFRKYQQATDVKERKLLEKTFTVGIKKHISDISSKYILTSEGTIDFALMYIPSEAVYYEMVNSQELYDYSISKRVLPVSPMTFYAFLRSILIGFEGQKISQQAHKILSNLRSIQTDYEKVSDALDTLQRHVNNSYNIMNTVNSSFSKLGQKIENTNALGEIEAIEAPKLKSS